MISLASSPWPAAIASPCSALTRILGRERSVRSTMPDLTDIEAPGRCRRDRLLMFAPIMPSDRGGGLAMRAGFFLDAYSRRFDVDLVVVPVAGSMEPTPFVRSRVRELHVLKIDRADSHYGLV